MQRNKEKFVRGSGNVFADLGLASPEERQAKARLMHLIATEIERRGLTQTEAAGYLGIAQSDVSNIVRGRGRTDSMDRLFHLIHRLHIGLSTVAHSEEIDETIKVFA